MTCVSGGYVSALRAIMAAEDKSAVTLNGLCIWKMMQEREALAQAASLHSFRTTSLRSVNTRTRLADVLDALALFPMARSVIAVAVTLDDAIRREPTAEVAGWPSNSLFAGDYIDACQ